MHHDFKSSLEVIILLIGVVTFLYKIASLEHKIFEAIDKTGDEVLERYNQLNYRLSIHQAECEQKEKNFNFCLREIKTQLEKINSRI